MNTFKNSFIWDDKDLIVNNQYIRSLKFVPFMFSPQYWVNSGVATSGQYRPIREMISALDYSVWKLNPAGYHLTNLILHILNVILIYFLVSRLTGLNKKEEDETDFKQPKFFNISFLAALFFASHPIHVESISWIKNRSDLLASLFFLSAFFLFIKFISKKELRVRSFYYFSALSCYIFALLSKEIALSLPFVLILYVLYFCTKEELKKTLISILPFLAIAISFFTFKSKVLGALISVEHDFAISLYSSVLVTLKTLGYYIMLLIFPFNLNADRLLTISETLRDPTVLYSLGLLFVCLIFIIKTFKSQRLVSFSIFWIFLTLLPVSNIVFLSARPIAEQRLYIPSLGFCLLMAIGVMALFSLKSRFIAQRMLRSLTVFLLVSVITIYFVTVIKRNFDWRNPFTFWSATLKSSPHSVRAHNNLGNEYSKIGKYQEAISLYSKAIEIDSEHASSYNNLANAYSDLGQKEKSIPFYEKAIELRPSYAGSYYNLANSYRDLNQEELAISFYKKAIEVNPDYADAYYNLGYTYNIIGRKEDAVVYYSKAREFKLGSD